VKAFDKPMSVPEAAGIYGNMLNRLKSRWAKAVVTVEIADIAFIVLRIIIFCGGIGWLYFSEISESTFSNVSSIFVYFVLYSIFIYLWLFLCPQKKKFIYGFSLCFDLLYASLLVRVTGGFSSSFFNGFYLITALYSFYFGLIPGTVIAAVSSLLYFTSCGTELCLTHWTDFFVRIAFLFLLAIPLGMLSQKLKLDKKRIEGLNSELQKSIEELRDLQGQMIQVEKLSAIGRLTADVAHEIRNPLTSIGGFARRLDKRLEEGSKEKGYASVVVAEVDRLERILRDVLTFSRESKLEMQYQGINSIIGDSMRSFSNVCVDQGIQVENELDASLPDVLIEREQVRMALDNLISNAIDVMPDGGRLRVRTCMKEQHAIPYVTIEVSDTGPGMDREALQLIFEPFYTTKEIGVGTGLGLSICKKIVDEHNGLIFGDSKQNAGTTFSMLFPYQSEKNGSRVKCWEFTKCGIENAEGAANMRCPAYPHYGRICWAIAGTFCGKKVSGAIAQKLGDCRKCEFYNAVVVTKNQ
jgi:signal transduction histidine kinase